MNTRVRSYVAWSVWGLTLVLAGATIWLAVLNGTRLGSQDLPAVQDMIQAVASLGFATVGALIASRRANAVGWLLSIIGVGMVMFPFAEEYTLRGLVTASGSLPATQWVAWTHSWAPFISVGAIPLLFLLFPDGHPPSPRWRPFGWVLGGGAAFFVIGEIFGAEDLQGYYTHFTQPLQSPVGFVHTGDGAWPFLMAVLAVMFLAALGCVAALLARYSRATGEQRQQLKWLAYAGAVMGFFGLILFVVAAPGREGMAGKVAMIGFLFAIGVGIPVAVAVAVFKYRLYDLDYVVKKTVMFGTLAAFISIVYVGIVVWLGSTLHGGTKNNVLVYSAAAVVAVGFQPVRSRAGRLADRVVYGRRATPYDVLSDLAHRMSDAYSVEDVLPKMVEAMASATGATRIGVWLRFDGEFRPVGRWPDGSDSGVPVAWSSDGLPPFDGWDRTYPVRQQDEILGAITLVERPSDPMVPAKERLILALAAQAGLVLRNVRLFEELKASRQRLVTAQDEERRRLERNIHDGAQQRLLTLAVAVGLTRDRVGDPVLVEELDRVGEELRTTLNELRELARGTYPAILTEAGLGPALESMVQRAVVPARLVAAPEGRLPAPVEATAYFVVSEALTNAARHAGASAVSVDARLLDGHLMVEVADDGIGGADPTRGSGLTGLTDRVAALGGTLRLHSPLGAGTHLVVEIPVP
jgi:signal transduction histidine kinase